jgi:16S rRNA G1207 methylase RsmC
MNALHWQMIAVAALATLLLVADLALRRRRSAAGAAVPTAKDFESQAATRRNLEALGLPLARQEATAESRVDQLAEAVEDAAAGRALVALADVTRYIRVTDRQLAQAGQSVDAATETKGRTDGG